MVNFRDIEISDELKQVIIEFFFVEYLNNNNIELSNNLEEKLLQTILNFCKEDIDEENNNNNNNNNDKEASNSLNKIRDIKICKKIKKIHLSFLNLVKANKISKLNEEDLQVNNFLNY